MVAAATAPFESVLPGSLFGFTLTTSELSVVVALSLAVLAWVQAPRTVWLASPVTVPAIALIACAIVAALVAPEFRGESLRVVARLAVAVLLFHVVRQVAADATHATTLVSVMVVTGAIVGVIAVVELTQWPWLLRELLIFRPGFHVVGGQVRATATLVYPTVTSMFLEVVFALGLALIGTRRWVWWALVAVAAGIVATFTRAGLITMAASLVLVGGFAFRNAGAWTKVHTRLALLAAAIVVLMMSSRSPQMLLARMSAEGSQEWYGASYRVPSALTLAPDSFNDIPVTLTNNGRLTWQSDVTPPFALSYHFLNSGKEDLVIFDGLRTPFPAAVEPGATAELRARVRAPNYPGHYVLVWDLVQEHRTWLSLEGVFPGRTEVSVEGAPVGQPLPSKGRMPGGVMRMPRSVLWSTAAAVVSQHPWLGIGFDNFRRVYGRYLGLSTWDTRVHTNNTYLEVLVGTGVIGGLALVWLLVAALRALPSVVLGVTAGRETFVAASLAAVVAIAAHGVVDSFLTFTATYVAFAIAAGILFADVPQGGATCA